MPEQGVRLCNALKQKEYVHCHETSLRAAVPLDRIREMTAQMGGDGIMK